MPSVPLLTACLAGILALNGSLARAQSLQLDQVLAVPSPHGTQLATLGSNRYLRAGLGIPSPPAPMADLAAYQTQFVVVDTVSPAVLTVDVPTGALLAQRVDELAVRPTIAAQAMATLVLYRPEEKRIGVVLRSAQLGARGPATRRHFYIEYAPGETQPRRWVRLADLGQDRSLGLLGVDPSGRLLDFYVEEYEGPLTQGRLAAPHVATLVAPARVRVWRLDLQRGTLESLATLPLAARKGGVRGGPRAVVSRSHRWFAYAEYSELGNGQLTPPPMLVVAELGGQRRQFADVAPVTPYGLVFDPAERFLFVGSNQLGSVLRYDLAGQRIDRSIATPKRLQRIFFSPSGRLVTLATGVELHSVSVGGDAPKRSPLAAPLDKALRSFYGSTVLETPDGRTLLMAAPPTLDSQARGPRLLYLARLIE